MVKISIISIIIGPFTYKLGPSNYKLGPFTYKLGPFIYKLGPFIYKLGPFPYKFSVTLQRGAILPNRVGGRRARLGFYHLVVVVFCQEKAFHSMSHHPHRHHHHQRICRRFGPSHHAEFFL